MWRTIKTIWLITQVTPYEQVGTIPNPPHILIIGDSTGYGTGAGDGRKSIAGLLGAEFPQYTITNNSKNGRTIGQALLTIQALQKNQSNQLLLLQIGGNDIFQKRPIAVVEVELQELLVAAKLRAVNVVMMSCGNVGAAAAFVGTEKVAEYERMTRQFREMFIRVAAQNGVNYVDLFAERDMDVFALHPEIYLAIDGLHPSAAGYAVWYQSVAPILQKIMPQR
jgi:lysophospholipase L1-like esterase